MCACACSFVYVCMHVFVCLFAAPLETLGMYLKIRRHQTHHYIFTALQNQLFHTDQWRDHAQAFLSHVDLYAKEVHNEMVFQYFRCCLFVHLSRHAITCTTSMARFPCFNAQQIYQHMLFKTFYLQYVHLF